MAINSSGDWIGFGCSGKNTSFSLMLCLFSRFDLIFFLNVHIVASGMGQLLVWEWQSESYVFKQQGHFNNMASLAYSPDGQYIATGGDDGKVGAAHYYALLLTVLCNIRQTLLIPHLS